MDPANLLRKSTRLYGHNTAYVCEGRRQTYSGLLDRAIRLANALRAAGVRVSQREFRGVTHEFFGADAVIADARIAQAYAGAQLRGAFARR